MSWEAFAIYRDIGISRRLRMVAEKMGKSYGEMEHLSREHRWTTRCRLYDAEQDRIGLAQRAKDIVEMNKRHAKVAQAIQAEVLETMRTLGRYRKKADASLDDGTFDGKAFGRWMSSLTAVLPKLIDVSIRTERGARGAPEATVALEHSGPGGGPIRTVHDEVVDLMADPEVRRRMDEIAAIVDARGGQAQLDGDARVVVGALVEAGSGEGGDGAPVVPGQVDRFPVGEDR